MIYLSENSELYDYDIRTLLQAFFNNDKIVLEKEDTDLGVILSLDEASLKHTVTLEIYEGIVSNPNIFESVRGDVKSKVNTTITREFTGNVDKALRDKVKIALYEILCEFCERTLPWGSLTGIRPVHIMMDMLDSGLNPEGAKAEFKKKYFATDRKTELSLRVALKEREVLASIPYANEYSLYIGIPFCPTTCLYCSFASYPIARFAGMVDDYLKALFKEIDYVSSAMKGVNVTSIYLGGGTPTAISAEQIGRLLRYVREKFDFTSVREFTVEAGRPDSITEDKLKVLLEAGVTRISINPQTMQDKTLELIGRKHTVKQFEEAYLLARKLGFNNINMDLIMGLLGETTEDVKDTLRRVKALAPDNLTIHSLAVKRAANLKIHMDEYHGHRMGANDEMLTIADQVATEMGLNPYYLYRQKNIPGNYENVGYAKEGLEGIYNILMMEEKQTVLALGAGTVSKFLFPSENRIERRDNVKDLKLYIERIDEMIDRKRPLVESLKFE